MTCLRGLSEPVVTSKLSGDLLTHLRAASEGHVKLYVVKCLLEEMPEQQYGNKTQHNPVQKIIALAAALMSNIMLS